MRLKYKVGIMLILLFLLASSLSHGYTSNQCLITIQYPNDISNTVSSEPKIEWHRLFGTNDMVDSTEGILPTEDGGYILLGYTSSTDDVKNEWWIVKINPQGDLLWRVSSHDNEEMKSTAPLSLASGIDEGFVLAGIKDQNNSNYLWFIKFDDTGNELWNITYRIKGMPTDMIQVHDGYVVVGEFLFENEDYDAGIIKIDEKGNLAWTNEFTGTLVSLLHAQEGGYLLIGEDSNNAIVIKINADGNQLWKKMYPVSNLQTQFNAIERTNEGNFVIIGEVNHFIEGYHEMRLVKITQDGDILIDRTIDGPYPSEIGLDIDQTCDNSFIILGCYGPIPGGKMCLVKIDSEGTTTWKTNIEGYVHLYSYADSMVQTTKDGGYVLAGMTENPVLPESKPNVFVTKYCSEDNSIPSIIITTPKNGLYFKNKKIFDIKTTIIFGPVDITCNATDDETGIDYIEIYVDDILRANLTTRPYVWTWQEKGMNRHTIKIIGYDHAGNSDSKQRKNIWKIN